MTRKRRQWILLGVLAVLVPLVVASFVSYFAKRHINKIDVAFSKVDRGMNSEQVRTIMGMPQKSETTSRRAYWDDELLNQKVADRIVREDWYTVRTFFLPISWVIGVDEFDHVVSKHRYD